MEKLPPNKKENHAAYQRTFIQHFRHAHRYGARVSNLTSPAGVSWPGRQQRNQSTGGGRDHPAEQATCRQRTGV